MRRDGNRPRMLRQHVSGSYLCRDPMTHDICIDALGRHEVRPKGAITEGSPKPDDIAPMPHSHACCGNAKLTKTVEKRALVYEREDEDAEPGIAHRRNQR